MRIIDAVLGLFKPSVVTTETKIKTVRLETVDSTNSFLRTYTPAADEPMTVAVAAYQTAGRGQGANTWESEAGKNLLFSVLVHPVMQPVSALGGRCAGLEGGAGRLCKRRHTPEMAE